MKKKDRKEFLDLEADTPGLEAYSKEFKEYYKNSNREKEINWTKFGTISAIILGILTILLMILL